MNLFPSDANDEFFAGFDCIFNETRFWFLLFLFHNQLTVLYPFLVIGKVLLHLFHRAVELSFKSLALSVDFQLVHSELGAELWLHLHEVALFNVDVIDRLRVPSGVSVLHKVV